MSVNLGVSVTTAYNRWTQFVPKLVEGVDSVRQIDDSTLHWRSTIGGVTREWTARITEQTPDQRIAWINVDGTTSGGVVSFHRLSAAACRVALQLDYEPEDLNESVGEALGVVPCRAKDDLDRFKKSIERRGRESGAFRGTTPSQNARG
jgi:uncharacterized membrane protein